MVAREGSAPPISGCRPDVMLFHYRAGRSSTSKLAAGDGLAPPQSPSKGDVLLIRRPGNELVESEVVATSPYRIKSPVPVCCGFDSVNGGRERTCTSKARRLSICGAAEP